MARKTIEKIYSDISGEEVEGDSATHFSFEGTSYEIDLTPTERDALAKSLAPYVEAARKTRGNSRAKRASAAGASDARAIRAWAAENNVEVPARGRVPAAVIEAYEAAH